MTDKLIERLREEAALYRARGDNISVVLDEAAQAIAALTAERDALRESLTQVCDCDHLHASHFIALKALKGDPANG